MTSLDFVIAGAQKGGSTQLAECLRRVPGVFLSRRECPAFESPYFESGAVDGLCHQLRGHHGSVCGIKRPSYLGMPLVAERLSMEFPKVKVVFSLRSPTDRAASAYIHYAEYGYVPIWPVSKGLDRLLDGYDFGNPRAHEILGWGRYERLLRRYMARFPAQQMIVIGSDDLRTDLHETVAAVVRQLGVDEAAIPRGLPVETNTRARSLLELRARRGMHRSISSFDPQTYDLLPRTRNPFMLGVGWALRTSGRGVRRVASSSSGLSLEPATRARLAEYYDSDVAFVQREFSLDVASSSGREAYESPS